MNPDPEFPLPSYSAFGEDRLIAYLLRDRAHGFYVDTGCCWPVAFSNTYLLYRRGWRGVAIDADPDAIEAFRRERPRDIPINAALGAEAGHATLHRFSDRSMNTIDPAWAAAAKANPRKRSLGEIEVERWPLRDLLARHMPRDTPVDFMNVDCEGADLEVLGGNDWERFAPHLLAVEDAQLDLARVAESAIYRFLAERAYRLVAKLHLTALYRRD